MNHYPIVTTSLAALSLLSAAAGLALLGGLVAPAGRRWLEDTLGGRERHPLAWAGLVALVATSGSLYLSDVVGLVPCLLCWYQRIAMYPLVPLLAVGLVLGDPGVWRYALPLAVVGGIIATYHVALQYNPSLEIVECTSGAPCSARYLAVFGFVSIPVMAGAGFLLIAALLLLLRVLERYDGVEGAEEEEEAP